MVSVPIDYKVVMSHPDQISQQVKSYIEQGWEPVPAGFAISTIGGAVCAYQVVVKYKSETTT